mgnify:CR=1 FL=1
MRDFIPSGLWSNFSRTNYDYISRLELWENAAYIISSNPLTGVGANAFSSLLENRTGYWRAHTHNLPLQVMVSYGIPSAILILTPVTMLIMATIKKVFFECKNFYKRDIYDRAWAISLINLTIAHLVDMQYFDGRISISGWVLLSGASNIIKKTIKT